MKHPEEVKRIFNKTDEEALEQSDVMLGSFQDNKSLFIERFTHLQDPFAGQWANAAETARSLEPDYASVAEQTKQTALLETVMDQGRNLYQTVILYTQLAFPDDAAILRLLGQPQYNSVRDSQLKLPVLLRTVYNQVSKPEYKAPLLAKGMKQSEIDLLDTLAGSITVQNVAQQKAKKERSLAASQRIVALNAVWEKISSVSQCAKLVFQNDAAKYNLFLLSDGEAPKPEVPQPKPSQP